MEKIKGFLTKANIKLEDVSGYFKRMLELKRLEKYANEIDMVLTKYNKKSCNETMMVKGLRKSCGETTNRKIHQEDLEKIAKEIAKKLGLNEEIIGIMGKHHDIGHTFLGHSGEWWISNVLEDIGMGCFCHNALGARELIYTNQVYDEIIDKIKVHNPEIKPKQLENVKKSLWLVIDGINAHNGETPEKEYIPAIHKTQEDFFKELISCYCIKGFDRKIVPASPEACLMRLADQISYIPLDMLDGLREGLALDKNGIRIDRLDKDYCTVLIKLGVKEQDIADANNRKDFTKVAERIKEILINNVIENSTKQKITMSKDTMKLMNELRNLNNEKIVNNVILMEDQQTYQAAVKTLMDRFSNILSQTEILSTLTNKYSYEEAMGKCHKYLGTPDEGFIKYVCNTNVEDFLFTLDVVEEATKQSVREELEMARQLVQMNQPYDDKKELRNEL